jgi:hypothetical protein
MKFLCDKKMSFEECELAILRSAVDNAETKVGRESVNSPEIKRMITILQNFLKRKKLMVYGGTAVNDILPKQLQFYNRDLEIPDYDFYSYNALNDAKELADTYFKEGFIEVEAKPGVHHGTYKVFVNFIPIADITFLHKEIFKAIKAEAIRVNGIYYTPPNFLRMSMYLELSRPSGDVSRWEKVLKRLTLLNKAFPLKGKQCNEITFQRKMENKVNEEVIYETTKQTFVDQDVVFFGGYAISEYSTYMPKNVHEKLEKYADFDVLSEDPQTTCRILKERLKDEGIKDVKIVKRPAIGEIVAPHYQVMVGKDTIAFIYHPIACHSYNVIQEHNMKIKVASIDTLLSFYLAFLYSDRSYYDKDRILCIANYLFKVQEHNRLRQKGLLKRFSINCYGHQQTLEEMRAEKAEKFLELKDKKKGTEYEEWFLRYRPSDNTKSKSTTIKAKKGRPDINKKSKKHQKSLKSTTKKRGRGGLFF